MDYMCIYFIHLPGSTPFSTFHLKPPAVCTDWSEEKRFFLPVDTTFFGYCSGFRQCAATPEMWWKNWWLLSLGITRERQIWRISWLKLANHGRRLFLRGCSSHHQRGGDKKRDHLSGAKSAISLWLSQHLSFPPPPPVRQPSTPVCSNMVIEQRWKTGMGCSKHPINLSLYWFMTR